MERPIHTTHLDAQRKNQIHQGIYHLLLPISCTFPLTRSPENQKHVEGPQIRHRFKLFFVCISNSHLADVLLQLLTKDLLVPSYVVLLVVPSLSELPFGRYFPT